MKWSEESKSELLNRNILLIEGDVEGKMVTFVYDSLHLLEIRNCPDIEVRIFSNGGSVGAGLDIFDALYRYPSKKTGVVYAYARSMGAIILQACTERVCLQHANILIHHINTQSVSLDVIDNKARLAKLRQQMWSDQKSLYTILAQRTGKSESEIRRVCKKDQDMTASEALAFGLIDRIERSGK